LIQIPF